MHRIKNYVVKVIQILDAVSWWVLLFLAIGMLLAPFDLEIWSVGLQHYNRDLIAAQRLTDAIFCLLAMSIGASLLKKKWPQICYAEILLWGVTLCITPYLLYKIPSVSQVEYALTAKIFYAEMLLLALNNFVNKKRGKYLICLLLLLLVPIYNLPEMEEITAIESCQEGRCRAAQDMGIIKIDNGTIVYIPKHDR